MIKRLKQLKNLKLPIIVSVIIAVAFLSYMYFIGVPKTRAAGYYQLAIQAEGFNDYSKANEYFRKAIEAFPESYIIKAYENAPKG